MQQLQLKHLQTIIFFSSIFIIFSFLSQFLVLNFSSFIYQQYFLHTTKLLDNDFPSYPEIMIYVVVEELIQKGQSEKHSDAATIGAMIGFAIMMTLYVALGYFSQSSFFAITIRSL